MLTSFTVLGFVAAAVAQGVTKAISPSEPAPPGCVMTDQRTFSITTVNATTARLAKRQADMGALTITLDNGVLTSNRGDTGYIAANDQFQFDSPPQTGARFTSGFSICPNRTLAIGGSTVFYSCISGKFSNLYSQTQGQQCSQVFIETLDGAAASIQASSSSASSTSVAPSSTSISSSATTAPVSSVVDGQSQAATSAAPSVSQISDNQPQVPTAAPTPTPVYTGGAPATGANLALAGAAILAAML